MITGPSTRRVLFYVQHILGIGHLARAARLTAAMRAASMEVCIVQGGEPVEGLDWGDVRLEQLPAIKAGSGGYADLVDACGAPVDDELKKRRCAQLLAVLDAFDPDVVLIEAFPFGRRAMRFELLPLLERIGQRDRRPTVACSIRDILHENRKPGLNEKTVDLLLRHFDLVLVHGDPSLIALEESFPLAGEIAPLVRHTGIVAPQAGGPVSGAVPDIVISAGGGAVGEALLKCAADALSNPALAEHTALIITGPNLPDRAFEALKDAVTERVSVCRFRRDFSAMLHHVRLSVSQCGYNTAADVLKAGCAAVFVPSAYQGETEQTRRADLLAARGLGVVVREDCIDADALAEAMMAALAAPRGAPAPDLDGAAASARILAEAA